MVNKIRCPICNKYIKSVHDELKQIKIKYNKVVERKSYLILLKRRFICHKCKKKIVEDLGINFKKRTVSKSLEIKIRKDLLKSIFNIKHIAEDNNVSHNYIRVILKSAMNDYPDYLKTLPQVISLDEFKSDTAYGKYVCVVNA